jgi:hypothetical protein
MTRHDDAFGGVVTLGLSVQRGISGKSLGDAHNLLTEQAQLLFDHLVLNTAGLREHSYRLGHRDHVGHGPPTQRPHRELHRVHDLQSLSTSSGADQADDFRRGEMAARASRACAASRSRS